MYFEFNKEKQNSDYGKTITNQLNGERLSMEFSKAISIYQYLQSKGYALDYYCPIAKRIVTVEEQVEAGWITLKTE